MLVMPLVANMEVRNVNVAIVDQDGQGQSRLFIEKIEASQYLDLQGIYYNYAEGLAQIETCNADVVVEIPFGYEKSLHTADPKQINVSANAVNGIKGSLGLQYVVQSLLSLQVQDRVDASSIRYLYNSTLDYRYFMIPALMIMLIIMICGFLPALNIVGEKEHGTIEQINVTPIGKLTFTIGKLLPYWIIGIIVLSIAMVIAWLVYGLVPMGSIYDLPGLFIFIVLMSSLGVFISNISDTMQQAMFVMFFFVVCFILMSGLMTPVSSMPDWAQKMTYAIPPRFFIDIMRATYLHGATVADQWQWFLILTVYAVLFATVAGVTYRKQG